MSWAWTCSQAYTHVHLCQVLHYTTQRETYISSTQKLFRSMPHVRQLNKYWSTLIHYRAAYVNILSPHFQPHFASSQIICRFFIYHFKCIFHLNELSLSSILHHYAAIMVPCVAAHSEQRRNCLSLTWSAGACNSLEVATFDNMRVMAAISKCPINL